MLNSTATFPQPWWQRLSRYILRTAGWELVAHLPSTPKYLIIGAFHTSNWDFPLALLAMSGMGIKPRWIGKDSLFHGLPGRVMKMLGGIPVVRGARQNFVQQIIDLYQRSQSLVIAMSPEGTRGKSTHWKTGFYYIARGAGIPIALGFVDYVKKQVGVGDYFTPSDDIQKDMEIIRTFYRNVRGKYPDQHGDIMLQSDLEK